MMVTESNIEETSLRINFLCYCGKNSFGSSNDHSNGDRFWICLLDDDLRWWIVPELGCRLCNFSQTCRPGSSNKSQTVAKGVLFCFKKATCHALKSAQPFSSRTFLFFIG